MSINKLRSLIPAEWNVAEIPDGFTVSAFDVEGNRRGEMIKVEAGEPITVERVNAIRSRVTACLERVSRRVSQ